MQVLYACPAVRRNIRWLKRMRRNRVEVLDSEFNKKNQEKKTQPKINQITPLVQDSNF